jgi:pimeloyl-ACP methyl ester carboxylesterase
MSDWQLARTFDTESGQVCWDVMGPPDAPAVVLLHGTPFSSYVWRAPARALATGHRVYVWDMPGYGQSAKYPGQDVSLAAQARVFRALLEYWGLVSPRIVAHDIGGAVALRALLRHGAGYDRLAVVDPVALSPWGSEFFRLVADNAEVFSAIPDDLHAALVREYIGSAGPRPLHPQVLDRLVAAWRGPQGRPAFYRQIAQVQQRHTDEIQPDYGRITMPVLVCWGEQDRWIPVAKATELAAAIPGARLVTFPQAGHLVQEDAPAELTAALLAFLG